ncbi:hypothetical protein EDD11_007356 [Mortierella claussenii]|nr:hypothetical protein EDD11_007356 [Mortierella claussenii]
MVLDWPLDMALDNRPFMQDSSQDGGNPSSTTSSRGSVDKTATTLKDHHHHQQHQQYQYQRRQSSLPSPPPTSQPTPSTSSDVDALFSNTPPSLPSSRRSSTSPSTLRQRCDALESELSQLRSQLYHSEQTSTLKEKRLSQAQQQSSNTQQSLQTLKQQHELTLIHLSKLQAETSRIRTQLEEHVKENKVSKQQVSHLSRELKEATLERDSLIVEMQECHSDNAKFLKRLRISNDQVDGLQDENRYLIEQLRELRARVGEAVGEKTRIGETLHLERHRSGQVTLELKRVVSMYKDKVERLQDQVLAMGHKHVQDQARLAIEQGKNNRSSPQMRLATATTTIVNSTSTSSSSETASPQVSLATSGADSGYSSVSLQSQEQQQQLVRRDTAFTFGDDALASVLPSVTTSSSSRRYKPTRRFTVNMGCHYQKAFLTPEQQKCESLMDQITVLQREYDKLRQEKETLELQLDLIQRQLTFREQQQQGQEQRQRRKEKEKEERHQQQQHQQQQQLSQDQKQYSRAILLDPLSAVNTTVQEAEEEAVAARRIQQQQQQQNQDKGLQRREALASLESKHDRSGHQNVALRSLEELRHLDRPQLEQGTLEQKQQKQMMQGASLQTVRDLDRNYTRRTQHAQFEGRHHLPQTPYLYQHQHVLGPVEWDIQQCSCCMGVLIEI